MQKLLKNKYFIATAVSLLVLAAAVPSIYFYQKYQSVRTTSEPKEAAKQEVASIVQTVGKLIMLPEGEEPTIATVSDVTKLTDQPFFARAANGDRVLIYSKAKKAILYRPSTDKIVEVAAINGGMTPESTPNPSTGSAIKK